MIEATAVADALGRLRDRVAAAGGGDELVVVAVTKGFGADAVTAALAAGCSHIGENYAQELLAKRDALGHAAVHFIGQLQRNKVRALVGVVDLYETVDRDSLASEIARRDPGARVLIQVNATDEPRKGGCHPTAVASLVEGCTSRGLRVEGLMTVGPTEGGPRAAATPFRLVRRLADELGLQTCSMGMSDDLEVAIAEGSTEIRVGTSLFGARPSLHRERRGLD